jgi:prepilin-type N-terminal cleavage/methylation domain-containing protein
LRIENGELKNAKMLKKKLSIINYQLSTLRGFTLVELIIVITVFTTLLLIATVNLVTVKQKSSLTTSVDVLVADMKQQQIKAMVGDTEGRGAANSYGVHFGTNTYVLFYGASYSSGDAGNLVVNLGDNVSFVNSPSDLIFTQISGNLQGGATAVTIKEGTTTIEKTVTINRYGVVTAVN